MVAVAAVAVVTGRWSKTAETPSEADAETAKIAAATEPPAPTEQPVGRLPTMTTSLAVTVVPDVVPKTPTNSPCVTLAG